MNILGKKMSKISLLVLGCAAFLAACAAQIPYEERADALIGLDEKALLNCAGLPEASFTTQDGKQVLVYSERRAELDTFGIGSGFGYWGHWGSCAPYYGAPYGGYGGCGPFGFSHDIRLRERMCQVGFWMDKGKVVNIMGENSPGGRVLCGKILNRCLQPTDADTDADDAPVEKTAGEAL